MKWEKDTAFDGVLHALKQDKFHQLKLTVFHNPKAHSHYRGILFIGILQYPDNSIRIAVKTLLESNVTLRGFSNSYVGAKEFGELYSPKIREKADFSALLGNINAKERLGFETAREIFAIIDPENPEEELKQNEPAEEKVEVKSAQIAARSRYGINSNPHYNASNRDDIMGDIPQALKGAPPCSIS